MRRLERALRGVVRDLNELGRSFALLGGFAVSAQVEPRTTRDVDLAVLVDGDADAESLDVHLGKAIGAVSPRYVPLLSSRNSNKPTVEAFPERSSRFEQSG